MTTDLNKMLQPGGIVPIDIPTTAALAAEVQRLREEVEVDNRNLGQLTDELSQCRREIERKDALLMRVLEVLSWHIEYDYHGKPLDEKDAAADKLHDAITEELAK